MYRVTGVMNDGTGFGILEIPATSKKAAFVLAVSEYGFDGEHKISIELIKQP